MADITNITFDRPDEREIVVRRLLPLLRRDDEVMIEEISYWVRSSVLEVGGDDLTMWVRLRPEPNP